MRAFARSVASACARAGSRPGAGQRVLQWIPRCQSEAKQYKTTRNDARVLPDGITPMTPDRSHADLGVNTLFV